MAEYGSENQKTQVWHIYTHRMFLRMQSLVHSRYSINGNPNFYTPMLYDGHLELHFLHHFISEYIETQARIFGSCYMDSAKKAFFFPQMSYIPKKCGRGRGVRWDGWGEVGGWGSPVLKLHCTKQMLGFHCFWFQPIQRKSFSEMLISDKATLG